MQLSIPNHLNPLPKTLSILDSCPKPFNNHFYLEIYPNLHKIDSHLSQSPPGNILFINQHPPPVFQSTFNYRSYLSYPQYHAIYRESINNFTNISILIIYFHSTNLTTICRNKTCFLSILLIFMLKEFQTPFLINQHT